ncbi:segregation/condensation protein A [Rhizobium sp. CFBP 8762]|uniref:segregation and condensation protein A n=1 Tax=Rhizobium sp. CFBP 8762 TaxID=2775279 RepID=UPI00177E3FEE|nr:ScpA family protein [Rhizobium sp. CFBP 8762]MBD8554627.1 segregation/condensation protein A [Rhizobium sp. CFBP 8762]
MTTQDIWTDADPQPAEALVLDIEGFEGPLDLLLHLARNQRVDLARISILALAEQYLVFVEQARLIRIELAADYLVIAAWLAFLKSKLLIPQQIKGDGPSGEELASALAFRLKRLEAMREAGAQLAERNRLGRDIFTRGAPEHVLSTATSGYEASLFDLLSAYAQLRQKQAVSHVTISKRRVWSLVDARLMLARLVGDLDGWTSLEQYLVQYLSDPAERSTAIASSFAASLELVREGQIELQQADAFSPIYIRQGPTPISAEALEAMETARNG